MYVAVKTPKAGLVGAEALLLKEARLLAHLRHPNLLRVYGLTAGTLGAALERRKGRPVRAEVRHTVSRGVAAALQHLHTQSPPVVHRDLSSANVLLAKGWQPRVCDFGLSRRKEASALAASAAGDGTPAYMAPEVLSSGRVTEKADVYSFGVLLWELVTGKTPWAEHTSFQVIYQVCTLHSI
jgi:serine/threonine protein kinase